MPPSFTVLASGSSGNAALLDLDGRGVLVDFGLSPRRLLRALERVGKSFSDVSHAVLSHLHGDHWNEEALAQLALGSATLWCHAEHADELRPRSSAFADLEAAGRVRLYDLAAPFLCDACRVTAFEVSHDVFTCGFRLEGSDPDWAIGFASDLGSWSEPVVGHLAEVDLLALEFNHDVTMQIRSRRHPWLIRRNLGDGGHLSNAQAAKLLGEILERTSPGRLRHVVPLHLSRQCNRPTLAVVAAREVRHARGESFHIVPASPHQPLAWIDPTAPAAPLAAVRPRPRRKVAVNPDQPFFPGWD